MQDTANYPLSKQVWPWLTQAIIVLAICFVILKILNLNQGKFTYTLDDAYIHLALSDNIANGHYGLNTLEMSAPSSSIIWPFILAAGSASKYHEYLPLALNIVFSILSVYFISRLLVHCGLPGKYLGTSACIIVSLLLILSINIIGAAFTGMEHSLQIMVTLCLVDGLIVFLKDDKIRWWLVVAIVIGPWIRYENSSLTLAAIVFFAAHRHGLLAVFTLAASASVIISFSWFLLHYGLPALPSSVLVKSSFSSSMVSSEIMNTLYSILANIYTSISTSIPGKTMIVLAYLLFWAAVGKNKERGLAFVGLFCIASHLLAGRYGWFCRYELYVFASSIPIVLFVYRDKIRRVLESISQIKLIVFVLFVSIICFNQYIYAFFITPQAANNIFEQQYQMHKFVVQYLKTPVAVNDLGLVSYKNPYYVLDLWGLGSEETRKSRANHNPHWLESMVKKYKVPVAIIYEDWFEKMIPPDWTKVARMSLGKGNVVCANPVVSFFVTEKPLVKGVVEKLVLFKAKLPKGVKLEIADKN